MTEAYLPAYLRESFLPDVQDKLVALGMKFDSKDDFNDFVNDHVVFMQTKEGEIDVFVYYGQIREQYVTSISFHARLDQPQHGSN